MPGLSVIKRVFKDQPEGFYSLSWKKDSQWGEEFFNSIHEAEKWLGSHDDGRDLYFCTTTLSAPKRTKGNVLPSMYLWQDLDAVDPKKILPKPTIAWESSPNRYQALWKLDRLYEPAELEQINKALAKKVKADRGSWILTKVLRIPGTRNFKYPDAPYGRLLWSKGKTYSSNEITNYIKPETLSSEELLAKHWMAIPEKVRNLLEATEVSEGTRSDTLWYIEHELAKAGIPLDEIYAIIKNSAWNKFKGRSDEQTRLTNEISRAFEDELIGDGTTLTPQIPDFESSLKNGWDLLKTLDSEIKWLVKDFWTSGSHGIVAGEPKSFKSTLVQDLAISVATGAPFLGKEVVSPGSVLFIQVENKEQIMRDRHIKILCSKSLVSNLADLEKLKQERKDRKKQRKELIAQLKITNGPKHREIQKSLDALNYYMRWDSINPCLGGFARIVESGVIECYFGDPVTNIYYLNQTQLMLSDKHHQKEIEKLIGRIKPKLIVLDPLYLMFAGDLNSSKELNPILSWLLGIKTKYSTSLILIHHWNKGSDNKRGGQRLLGSTTLHGWTESAWYISVKPQGNQSPEEGVEKGSGGQTNTTVFMEREFREAGHYPIIGIDISMSKEGNYKIGIGNATPEDLKNHKNGGSTKRVLTKEEEMDEIMNVLKTHKKMTAEEIIAEVGRPGGTIRDYLKNLKEEGMIEKLEDDTYQLLKQPK